MSHKQAKRQRQRQDGAPGQQDAVVLLDKLKKARPAARYTQHKANRVAIVADAKGRTNEENQRQVHKEELDQTQLEQPGHGAIPGRRVRVADGHDTAGWPEMSRPNGKGGLLALAALMVMMKLVWTNGEPLIGKA